MALIHDIQPPGPRRRLTTQAVERRVKEVHQATNIPKLIYASQQRVSSFDILPQVRPIPTKQPIRPAEPILSGKSNIRTKPNVKSKASFWRRAIDYMQYPIIAVVAIGAAYSAVLGQVMILLFLLASLIFKASSRTSFVLAIVLLTSIPFFQVINQSGVSQNSAIYAFEMLVAGTFLALIELLKENRQKPINKRFSTESR